MDTLQQHPGGRKLTKRLLAYCGLKPGEKVVDLGCGAGETVEYLRKELGLDAAGVDRTPERLEIGRNRSPGLPLWQAEAENLPFEADSLAAVIAECSLSVMKDVKTVLAEAARVLHCGGKLALTDVYDRNSDSSLPPIFLTYPSLASLLEETGFKILVWEDCSESLAEFAANFIMNGGSRQQLWQSIASCKNSSGCGRLLETIKPGYFLLVAEKCREN